MLIAPYLYLWGRILKISNYNSVIFDSYLLFGRSATDLSDRGAAPTALHSSHCAPRHNWPILRMYRSNNFVAACPSTGSATKRRSAAELPTEVRGSATQDLGLAFRKVQIGHLWCPIPPEGELLNQVNQTWRCRRVFRTLA